MERLKIMVLANDTTYTYNLRRELLIRMIAEGHKVTLACELLRFQDELSQMGCRLINISTGRRGTNPLNDLLLLLRYLSIIRNNKPDVVLSYNIKPNIYGGIACRLLHIRYYPNITGLGKPMKYPGLLQKLTIGLCKIGMHNANAVFFQNSENESFFRQRNILTDKTKTVMLPGSGVNLQQHKLEPYPKEESTLLFLVVGRIMREKGTDEVLYAAEVIKRKYPNVIFRFLGDYDGDYEKKIDNAVRKGTIEYIGHVADVHSHLKECHAIVHASYHEGMANVLLESAACGRPIVATEVPGCKETFDEGISGFSCQARNADSLIAAICKFIELPYVEKEKMGLAGRLKMVREFDRDFVVEKYLEEIRSPRIVGEEDV